MNESTIRTVRNVRPQRGFTLVELMVAMTVSLFLLGGLFATVQSTRRAYGNQNLFAQLQDNERLAMTLISQVVETAGYYPNPIANTNIGIFPNDAVFPTPGQVILGAANGAGPGDAITVRYALANLDNAYNCIGQQNTTGATQVYENTFSVVGNQLVCNLNNGLGNVPLITKNVNGAGVTTLGVQNMTILYGVKANPADTGSCADTYLTAAQVTAANGGAGLWSSVCSVNVTLTFINPITPAGPGITISRVIAVMGTAGVNS